MTLDIVFAGTPPFVIPCLDALASSHHSIKAIYTQPDRPAGRGRKLQPSAAKLWGDAHRLTVCQPLHFKTHEALQELATFAPDVLVVIAYGLILPSQVLNLPRLGCLNVHASLLPRWRGASPIQQAILHGDSETGISIMQMDKGMDTGPILKQAPCSLERDTASSLHDRLSHLAVAPLLEVLDKLGSGETITPVHQDNTLATYAPKIHKQDALIRWQQPAVEIDRQIRAFNPWPIAMTYFKETVIRIHQAAIVPITQTQKPGTILSIDKNGILIATGQQALLIERLQFPGAKAMHVTDWLNANRDGLSIHSVLGPS